MSNSRSKPLTTMIALFLTLSMVVPFFAVANAQNSVKTYPIIEALPNPVGKGQATLINFGLINYLRFSVAVS